MEGGREVGREGGREGREGGREDVHVTSNVELRNCIPLFGVTHSNVDLRNYVISRQIVIYIWW